MLHICLFNDIFWGLSLFDQVFFFFLYFIYQKNSNYVFRIHFGPLASRDQPALALDYIHELIDTELTLDSVKHF